MSSFLLVKSFQQVAELWRDGRPFKTYKISTARNGLGNKSGSFCTPSGRLKIVQKVGHDLPPGSVLRARKPSGEVWSIDPANPLFLRNEDLVLTRVMWLAGDDSSNQNTLFRHVYLQGTNREGLLGTPDSTGSIRFSNADIIEVFDLLEEGAQVRVL